MPEPGQRGNVERLAAPRSRELASRCLSLTLRVPTSYEMFERDVMRWIGECVMSRTEDARGVPMHREHELVPNNPSLRQVWTIIREQVGQSVVIGARYTWINERVEGVVFSVNGPSPRPRRGRVTGGDMDVFSLGDPDSDIDQAGPEAPILPRPGPSLFNNPFSGVTDPASAFSTGLNQIFRTYYQNVHAGHERARFGGRAIGFADTLARMAADLPADAERTIRSRPPSRRWDSVISDRVLGNPVALEGYLEGYDDAVRFIRERYEQTRPYDESTGRLEATPSVAFLRYLRMTYAQRAVGSSMRTAIREGILQAHFPELNRLSWN